MSDFASLLPVSMSSDLSVNSVDARQLHEALELKTGFSDWVRQIKTDFEQGVDFVQQTVETGSARRDFIFSLDMAKQVAMMTRTEIGTEVRKYFIACEKHSIAVKANPFLVLQGMNADQLELFAKTVQGKADADRQALQAQQQLAKAQLQIEASQPAVAAMSIIQETTNCLSLNETAKQLGIGRNTMMQILRHQLILIRGNLPAQKYLDMGYFDTRTRAYVSNTYGTQLSVTTVVTGRGLIWLAKKKAEGMFDE